MAAARHCYWFIGASGGSDGRPKVSAYVPSNTEYFRDYRKR
ncbi:hypothetical protein ACS15_2208 [Ralstonia insidiosa]|uniref:Uncharacterized protein n=1 Tax=Ralstonia insidiosa TaxID=190721 RepID=A0AAC9BGZ3_9RALS|nr:hypothetical protein ACS15_2208 [Ralstonia insidiosa]